jgi:hypothetical protein
MEKNNSIFCIVGILKGVLQSEWGGGGGYRGSIEKKLQYNLKIQEITV